MILYHLTPARNIPALGRQGLIPRHGVRAKRFGEPRPAIYCFASMDDLDEGLVNWLADEFPETTRLALLEIDLPDTLAWERVAFEIQVFDPIPPAAIRIVSRDYGA